MAKAAAAKADPAPKGKPAEGGAGGMDKDALKPILRMAKDAPVSAAFALGADGKAVLQLDRRKPPEMLGKQLRNEAPDSKGHRWGTVQAAADDPKRAVFTLNKASSGAARKLVAALKGTGFSKVELRYDDGTAPETHEEDDAPDPGAAPAQPGPAPTADAAQAPPAAAAPVDAPAQAVAPDAAQAAPPGAGPANSGTGGMKADLVALLKSGGAAIAASPALADAARAARAALAANDPAAARTAMDTLSKGLAAPAQAAPATPAQAGPDPAKAQARYGKAADIWAKTVAKMENDLHQIRKDMLDAFGGDEEGKQMEQEFLGEIEGCVKAMDLSLHAALDGLAKADAPAAGVQAARALVDRHMKHLDDDHFMQNVDDNPSGIKVKAVLARSLQMIHGVLQA